MPGSGTSLAVHAHVAFNTLVRRAAVLEGALPGLVALISMLLQEHSHTINATFALPMRIGLASIAVTGLV